MAKRKPTTRKTSRTKKSPGRAARPARPKATKARAGAAKAAPRRERAHARPAGRPVPWVCSGCGRSFKARAVYRCPSCSKPVRYVGPRISAPEENEGTGMWIPSRAADLVSWSGATGKHSAVARASRPSERVPLARRLVRKPAAAAAAGAAAKKAAPRASSAKRPARKTALAKIGRVAARLVRKVRKVATRIGRKVAPKARSVRRPKK